MKKTIMNAALGVLLTLWFAFGSGCSKVNTENYDRLRMGMSYEAVVALLGDADTCSGAVGIKSCTWGSGDRYIMVNFAGNKVILFSAEGL